MRSQLCFYLVLDLGCTLIYPGKGVPVNPLFERSAQLPVSESTRGNIFNTRQPADGKWSEPDRKIHLIPFPKRLGSPVDAEDSRRWGDSAQAGRAAVEVSNTYERRINCEPV
jgi:hypothetical protein